MVSPSSSPVITSEGSPIIILADEGGWWLLVQGSSCTMPSDVEENKKPVAYPFMLTGFYLVE